ncbi:MAG: AraC family transcriptional regulator [Pseudolabrys sp.]
MVDGVATLRISTDGLPERERATIWRELYGREVLRLEVEPLGDAPFHSEVTARLFPGLGIISGHSTAFRVGRTSALLADGNDNLIFQLSDGPGVAKQLGRDVEISASDAIVLSNADAGTFTYQATTDFLALNLSRAPLVPLLRDPNILVRPVPGQTAAMRLLVRYLDITDDAATMANPEIRHLIVTHVYDLVALALGATRDAAYIAEGRGLRAARLRAIKDDVRANLHRPEFSIAAVARHQKVTPRYIQQLFDSEGTTFSEFVRDQRLMRAHRMLADPRHAALSVSYIAYGSGFGDLSYFNRVFHLAFGMSPSDVRHGARDLGAVPPAGAPRRPKE